MPSLGVRGHIQLLLQIHWRIILTSGLQVSSAYVRPNTTAAALTCCSLYLFSSCIFCTMCNPPPQQAALYRALSATAVTGLPQDSVARQYRSQEGVETKWSSGKALSVLSCEAMSTWFLWQQSSAHPWARELKTDADNGPQLSNMHGT